VKVAVCGSMAFIDEMEALAAALRVRGEVVHTPVRDEKDFDGDRLALGEAADRKRHYLTGYLEVIRAVDVVLIANFERNGVEGYVGPNALVEAAFGHALGKRVVLLNRPGRQPCRVEILAMMTGCLDGEIDRLR
jgi:hypothetical protein